MQLTFLLANPHFYDYLHLIDFRDDGTVELVDGAGQLINAVARGRYSTRDIDAFTADVTFYDLREVDPYRDYAQIGTLPDRTVRVAREVGTFSFLREVLWKVKDVASHPALLYPARYVFQTDPLAFGQAAQANNLYYAVEPKELGVSARFYYPRDEGQKLTYAELLALGIPDGDIRRATG